MTEKEIDCALDSDELPIRLKAIQHQTASVRNLDKALDDDNILVRLAAIKHPNIIEDQINYALRNKNKAIRLAAIQHPNATINNIHTALQSADIDIQCAAIEHPNSINEHVIIILNRHKQKTVDDALLHAVIEHPTITVEQLHSIWPTNLSICISAGIREEELLNNDWDNWK